MTKKERTLMIKVTSLLVVIALILVGCNPNFKDLPNKITYEDLQNFPQNDSLEKLIIETDEDNFNNLTFEATFKLIFKDFSQMTLKFDDFVTLVKKGALTESQAIMIWENFVAKKNTLKEANDKNKSIFTHMIDFVIRSTGFIGYLPVILILSIGFIILLFLYFYLGFGLYVKRAYFKLLMLSTIFLYIFSVLAINLLSPLNMFIMSSIIYIVIYVIYMIIGHGLLCIMKMQNFLSNLTEIFHPRINYRGKLIMAIYSIIISYAISFQSSYFLTQIPFYLSMAYFIWILSKRYYMLAPEKLQPFGVFNLGCASTVLLIYLYMAKEESFIPSIQTKQFFYDMLGTNLFDIKPDFSFLGYIVSTLFGLFVFPLYIFVQYQNQGDNYLSKKMKYADIMKNIFNYQYKERFSLESSKYSIWLLMYSCISLFYMYVGFEIKHSIMILLAVFSMQTAISVYSKEKGIINIILFYTCGFLSINMTYFIGKMQDNFSFQVKFYHYLHDIKVLNRYLEITKMV